MKYLVIFIGLLVALSVYNTYAQGVDLVETERYVQASDTNLSPLRTLYNNQIPYPMFFGFQKAIPTNIAQGEKQGKVPVVTVDKKEDLTQGKDE